MLTKEPAPGKASTMPGSQMSQHANGVIGHTSSSHKPEAHGGKTSSGSSVSSGYVSSSSRYSHSSKGSSSQGLSTAADGGSARRRTAAQQTAASVSESQRVALINAATVPADGPATSRVHGEMRTVYCLLTSYLLGEVFVLCALCAVYVCVY